MQLRNKKMLCLPYGVFLICFVLAPLVVIIYYALTNGEGRFTLENLTGFFENPKTTGTLLYSFKRLPFACVSDCLYPCTGKNEA